MKKNRKCDTQKYKRRRKAEKVAHTRRVRRRETERIELYRIYRAQEERRARERYERKQQAQSLVNILARRLYQLSPEYARKARVKELFSIAEFFGSQIPEELKQWLKL